MESDGLMAYLDLGGEVLHDGADELGFVGCEAGGFRAWVCGSGGGVHGCVGGVFYLVCVRRRGFGWCGEHEERENEGAMDAAST